MVRRNKTVLRFLIGSLLMILTAGSLSAEEIAYDSGKRRDPFVALTADDSLSMSSSSSGIRLEGIIYDPSGRSMAILNGKTYLSGEAVGEAKVVSIHKDHVVISMGGEEQVLRIREEEKS